MFAMHLSKQLVNNQTQTVMGDRTEGSERYPRLSESFAADAVAIAIEAVRVGGTHGDGFPDSQSWQVGTVEIRRGWGDADVSPGNRLGVGAIAPGLRENGRRH